MSEQSYIGTTYRDLNPLWHADDANWKASYISALLARHEIQPRTILDVGCGTGGVLSSLLRNHYPGARGVGYDIAPYPLSVGKKTAAADVELRRGDVTTSDVSDFDLLICIDVFEHVENYMEFLRRLTGRAKYYVFHIPLDLDMQALLRNRHMRERNEVGHLHYFDKLTALATLRDTGYEVIASGYTKKRGPHWKARLLELARTAVAPFTGTDISVRIFGGHSLLVLATAPSITTALSGSRNPALTVP